MRVVRAIATSLIALSGAGAALADSGPTVTLDSAVYVEHVAPGTARTLEPAKALNRGDRLVYVLRWYRLGGAGGFTVTNPLGRRVAYQASAEGDAEVSVDGGRHWGHLGALRVGSRLATPEDVTHVRWRVTAREAAAGAGRIAYSAIVR